MATFIDNKTKHILDKIDKMVPMDVDCEINYALKCYYLGQYLSEEETNKIIEQRNKELTDMVNAMTLTSFEQLDAKPSEEETKCADNINGREDHTSIIAIDT